MYKYKYIYLLLGLRIFCFFLVFKASTPKSKNDPKECFKSNLHYTTDGMKCWYGKTSGGVKSITNVPYDNLNCKNCHTGSCDACHEESNSNKCSTKNACGQETCLKCHGREANIIKIDRSEEIHGNGIRYNSMKDIGFLIRIV